MDAQIMLQMSEWKFHLLLANFVNRLVFRPGILPLKILPTIFFQKTRHLSPMMTVGGARAKMFTAQTCRFARFVRFTSF